MTENAEYRVRATGCAHASLLGAVVVVCAALLLSSCVTRVVVVQCAPCDRERSDGTRVVEVQQPSAAPAVLPTPRGPLPCVPQPLAKCPEGCTPAAPFGGCMCLNPATIGTDTVLRRQAATEVLP